MILSSDHTIEDAVLGFVGFLMDITSLLYAVLITVADKVIGSIEVDNWMKYSVWVGVVAYIFFRALYWYWKMKGKRNQVKHYEERKNHTDKI